MSARQYGQRPARKFADNIGAMRIVGRFIPGTLTNSRLRTYIEPEVILVTDPAADSQALSEAVNSGLPVVGICDANNMTAQRRPSACRPTTRVDARSLSSTGCWPERFSRLGSSISDADWERSQSVDDWESTF